MRSFAVFGSHIQSCGFRNLKIPDLQETKLHILETDECENYARQTKIGDFDSRLEFCSGFRYKAKESHRYVAEKDESSGQWRFTFLDKTTEETDMVGGRDTCEGDSGNAFFK